MSVKTGTLKEVGVVNAFRFSARFLRSDSRFSNHIAVEI